MAEAASFASFSEQLAGLVASFHKRLPHLRSDEYDESSLRNDYLTPLWRALGWDVENRLGATQSLREVHIESRVDIAGKKKRADYLFRTDGLERFVSEAKRPSEDLLRKWCAYQAQRYAFNLSLRVATLTNFEMLLLFPIGGRPDPQMPWAPSKQWHYTEYILRAQEIWDLFARNNVASGSLDKYIASLPKKPIPGKARQGWLVPPERVRAVDADFLAYIEQQREILARHLVRENPGKLDAATLNECIQRILDRILFVRICEDRDIDTGSPLDAILSEWEAITTNRSPLYDRLVAHFNSLDTTFNGALFRRGHYSEQIAVPDEYLVGLIRDLSSEDTPYLFSTLPVEILGSVYEQFIARVVRFTRGGKPQIEYKSDVRKAGGVFYTPRYVVDFIVDAALGELLQEKAPKELATIKLIDPACGSGSFLIRAFERICEFHLSWLKDNPKQQRPTLCYRDEQDNLHLTTHLKREIMLNSIYGVDVDQQAVEVTMLSLYLKILEGETRVTLGRQRELFPDEQFLPDLASNIKCGNSLIGTDYYEQMSLIDPEPAGRTNAFDWETEFPFLDGGFDAVLGNPPWGAEFTPAQRDYLATHYSEVVARMVDSYIYFIGKGIRLLRENGKLGLIIPSTMLNQVDAQPVRGLLLYRGISHAVNLGKGVFGPKPLNTSTILVSQRRKGTDLFRYRDLSRLPLASRRAELKSLGCITWAKWKDAVMADPHLTYFLGDQRSVALLARLRKLHPRLLDSVRGKIERGVSPDVVQAHVLSKGSARAKNLETALLRPSVSGSQIKRYRPWKSDQWILYTTRRVRLRDYPNAEAFLGGYRRLNKCKEARAKKHPWWCLHRPRKLEIFARPKIIGLTTTKTIELAFDDKGGIFVTDAMYVFSVRKGIDPWALMAVMQSSLFLFLYRVANQGEARVIPQIKAAKLQPLPMPNLRRSEVAGKLAALAKRLLSLNRTLASTKSEQERGALERRIAADDRAIDELVYQLYGLTHSEVALIEGPEASCVVEGIPVERPKRVGRKAARKRQSASASGASQGRLF